MSTGLPFPLWDQLTRWALRDTMKASSSESGATEQPRCKVNSCAVAGLDGALIDVKVDISNGQPGCTNTI